MVDEWLTKGATLVSILHCLLVADAREAKALDDNADAFMIEIGHDDCLATLVLALGTLVGY